MVLGHTQTKSIDRPGTLLINIKKRQAYLLIQKMMKSFTTAISILFIFALSLSSTLHAANIQSVKSGDWDDPTVWDIGRSPGGADNVSIKVGHVVQLLQPGVNVNVASLTIEATGKFILGNRVFTVLGTTNVSGTFRDIIPEGTNTFQGKVSVLAGGVWNTLGVTGNPNRLLFGGGIESSGDSMLISIATIVGQNQTFSGTTQIYVSKDIQVSPGLTVTNNNSAGMFFDNGQIRGQDETAKFINKTRLIYHDRNAPMTPGTVDFSQTGNTVIYGRRDNQFIRPTTHYNVIITDHDNPTDGNPKIIQPGLTTITNSLIVEKFAELDVRADNMNVTGSTVVYGEIFDAVEAGSANLASLVIDGGKLHGQPWGFGNFTITGDLTFQGTDPILEDGALDVRGITTVKAGTTLRIEGGGPGLKQFNTFTVEAGANLVDIGNNGTLKFRERLDILDGAFILKQDTYFEKGFVHFGDTLAFDGPINFVKNNQEGRTNRSWSLKQPINIGTGVRALVNFEGGLNVPKNRPYLFSEDATGVFANKGILIFNENIPKLENATVDFTEAPNEVIMNMLPADYVELPGGDFYSLTIVNERQGNRTMFCFLPFQTIHCRGDFTLSEDISLNPTRFSLEVDGWGRIYSEVFDNDTLGVLKFANLEMGRGRIDGNNWRKGKFSVTGDLLIRDTVEVVEADFAVGGMTTIKENGLLLLTTKEGDRSFGGLTIEKGGALVDNTLGEDFVFDGPVNLEGSLELANGNCIFTHPVNIGTNGTLTFTKEWGRYNFTKGIINNGVVALGNGTFSVAGEVGGTAEISLNSDITVGAGDTLTNTNSAAFTVGGVLNGEDESSVFINQGIFNYAPRAANFPMLLGTFDAFTDPDNWVKYSGTNGWQEIETGKYRNIAFLNGGNKKLIGGNIEIYGDIEVRETTVRKAQDPFSVGVAIIVGTEDQHISGDVSGLFEELFIEKPSGKVILESDFGITGTLLMKSGIMIAEQGGLFLANNSFLQETENAYVIGRVAAQRDICEGCAQDFGGLGLKIQSGSGVVMGPTRVVRHTGKAFVPGQITRYYQVLPTNNENLNASIEFAYLEREINGAVEQNLDLVSSVDGTNFTILGGKNLTKSNVVQKTKIQEFGYLSLVANTTAITAYPSPFVDGNLTIDYVVEEDMQVDLKIFDRTGRTFVRRTVDSVAGLNTFKLEGVNLAAGVYFIRIVAGDKRGTQTILKLTP